MMRHIKLFAVIIAAVILIAVLSACKISISNKDNNESGVIAKSDEVKALKMLQEYNLIK